MFCLQFLQYMNEHVPSNKGMSMHFPLRNNVKIDKSVFGAIRQYKNEIMMTLCTVANTEWKARSSNLCNEPELW